MRHFASISVLCTLLALLLGACIKDDDFGIDPNLPTRTVIVYLGGDNTSLSSTLQKEVEALRKGWTYTGNRCVIYLDPVDDVPRLLSLRGGCTVTPTPYIDTLAVYTEENSASAAVFRRVMDDAIKQYPADSYGLIFASHGSGWLPKRTLAHPTRSLSIDANTGTMETDAEMELADFAAAIPEGRFDFIVFEACLMSGVEVAYELRDKADYILASSAELLVPGFVPIYPQSLHYLMETNRTVEQSLTAFGQSYYDYIDTQSGAYRSTTLSIIKTEQLPALAALMKRMSEILLTKIPDINSIQHFDRPGSYGDYPVSPRFLDFMDYMQKITSPADYNALESLMNAIVIWKAATPTFMDGYNGFAITHHCGLTAYIEQECFPKLNEAYRQTAWYGAIH